MHSQDAGKMQAKQAASWWDRWTMVHCSATHQTYTTAQEQKLMAPVRQATCKEQGQLGGAAGRRQAGWQLGGGASPAHPQAVMAGKLHKSGKPAAAPVSGAAAARAGAAQHPPPGL